MRFKRPSVVKSPCYTSLNPVREGDLPGNLPMTSHAHWNAHTRIQPHTSSHSTNNKHLQSQDSLGFFFCWFAYPDIYVSRANNCSFTFTIWQGLPCGFSASVIRKLTDAVVFIVIITFRNGYPLQWESLYGSAV